MVFGGLNIGIYGFGAIGRLLAEQAVKRGYEIVGVVDIDENIVGKDIGLLIGLSREYGVEVSKDPMVLADADLVYHATGSYLDKVYQQLVNIISLGIDVVSTCETLAYPYYRYPVLARKLDENARENHVTVIGAGINPGFIMDVLAITLSSSIPVVKRLKVVRSVDAGKRRASFRKKIGVGLEPNVAREKLLKGELSGHVGYAESIYLIADASGIHLDRVVDGQDIVVADKPIVEGDVFVDKNMVIGIKGYGAGFVGDREVIRLELYAYVGAEDYDEIVVEGDEYSVKWVSSGTPGDQGTVAVLLNIGEKIGRYGPGLLTLVDIIPYKPFFKI